MQLGVGKIAFPSWAAALTLVKDHGGAAVDHATDAIRADTGARRLDSAVRAMTSFDHAIDNSQKLPVQWFVRRAGMYYRGYEAAKQAVNLLVASGLIPGAKQRVGVQSLVAAKETFLTGVGVAASDRSRYGRHLASGWLEATAEDALLGAAMLQPGGDTTRALLAGINHVRGAVAQKRPVDPALVRTVSELFDRATSQLSLEIARAGGRAVEADPTAFERSGVLLAQAREAAQALVQDAPDASVLEQLPAAS